MHRRSASAHSNPSSGRLARRSTSSRLAVEVLEDRDVPAFLLASAFPANDWTGLTTVGDFNGDAVPDLVTPNGYSPTSVSIRLGNGDGTFGEPIESPTGSTPNSLLAVGDFNRDGRLDVVTANYGGAPGGTLSVMSGNGDGTLQAPRTFALPAVKGEVQHPEDVAVGDMNNDGSPDLVVLADGARSSSSWTTNTYVHVLPGAGDGTFRAAGTYLVSRSGWGPPSLALGDFNGDGKLDVLTSITEMSGSQSTRTKIALQLGKGDGYLGGKTALADIRTPFTYFTRGGSLAVGDFNADGRLDFVTALSVWVGDSANPSDAYLYTFLGQGNGNFTSRRTAAGEAVVQPVVGDFNGDGRLDVATAGGGPTVYLGNGDGTYAAVRFLGPGTFSLAAGDLNRDGRLDLVATTLSGSTWSGAPYGLAGLLNDGIW